MSSAILTSGTKRRSLLIFAGVLVSSILTICSLPAQELESVDWSRLSSAVDRQVRELRHRLLESRRGFYRSSGEQEATSRLVSGVLKANGFQVKEVGYSLYGTLVGAKPGPTVALRFEMDAVKADDAPPLPRLRPDVEGVRHLLGNDGQLALATTLAVLFSRLQSNLPGTIRIIVQSGSTRLTGAQALIEAGALENQPAVEAVYAAKMAPLPAGSIGIQRGQALAAGRTFEIEFPSGPSPGEIEDRLQILGLQEPTATDLIHFFKPGSIVEPQVPDEVIYRWVDESGRSILPLYRGKILALDPAALEPARVRLLEVLEPFQRMTHHFSDSTTPPLLNHPDLVEQAVRFLRGEFSAEEVLELEAPIPFLADDVSLFQEETKLLLLWLGVAHPEENIRGIPGQEDLKIADSSLVRGLQALAKLPLYYMTERVNALVR